MARRGKFRWLGIALLAAAVVVAVVFMTQDRGPTYKGRTVMRWVQEPAGEISAEVINAFGPEATSYLISACQREPTVFNKIAWLIWRKLPPSLRSGLWKYAPVDVAGSASRAADWLKALGPDAHAAIPALTEAALRHPDRFKRSSTINILGLVGARSPGALQTLTTLLEDPDEVVCDSAALAIAPFGTNAVTAVPVLTEIVKSRPKPFNALMTLSFIGPPAHEAVPVIMERLKEPELSGNALTALAGIGSGDGRTVSALIELMPSLEKDSQVRLLETLRKIGPAGKAAALPAIRNVREGETNILRLLAAMAIAGNEQKPGEAMPVLIEALEGKLARDLPLIVYIPSHRTTLPDGMGLSPPAAAAWYLADLGPMGQPALPHLKALVSTGRTWEQVLAARAIWRISGDAAAVAPVLVGHLKSDDTLCLFYGLETLGEMGRNVLGVAPSLVDFINTRSNSWSSRRQALSALERIDPDSARKLELR